MRSMEQTWVPPKEQPRGHGWVQPRSSSQATRTRPCNHCSKHHTLHIPHRSSTVPPTAPVESVTYCNIPHKTLRALVTEQVWEEVASTGPGSQSSTVTHTQRHNSTVHPTEEPVNETCCNICKNQTCAIIISRQRVSVCRHGQSAFIQTEPHGKTVDQRACSRAHLDKLTDRRSG